MAMSAKKMIVDVAAGAASMFAQGGWAGFAGVAAMMAVMGGLGFAMSSGSKPAQDDTMKASATTGTVLGDATASSNSIKNIIQTLNDIHAKEYPELKTVADAFKTLGGSVDGFIKNLAQRSRSFTDFKGIGIPNAPTIGNNGSLEKGFVAGLATTAVSAGMAAAGVGTGIATTALASMISTSVAVTGGASAVTGALVGTSAAIMSGGLAAAAAMGGIGILVGAAIYGVGKLIGVGKTKLTQLGEGLVINSVNMFQDGMENALNPQTFAKWEAKTKGWFSDTKKIIESFGNLSDDMKGAILDIYIATKGAILASSTSLGLNDLLGQKILDYTTPNLKIDWFKIKTEKGDVGKYISDTLNTMTDSIATDIFGNLLGSFQDMGEGMLETIARLGSQYAIVSSTLGKYGEKLQATDMGMIGLSDSLVRMYSATGDAKEGLKNFIDVMNSFYDAVVPQGIKSQKAFSNMTDFSKNIGVDEKDLGSPDVLKAAIFDNFEKKKKLADEAAIAEAELTRQREAVNNFYNPKTSTDLNTQLDPIWAKYSKTTDWANFQFSDLTNGFTEELVRSRALEHAGTSAGMLYSEIIRVAETNAKNKAAGLASGGNKWLSVADLEASIAPLSEKLKTANENLAAVTALTPDLKEWEKAVTDLADNYQEKFLNLGRTDAEKIAVERAKILKNVEGLNFDFSITKGFVPIIKAMRAAGIQGEINAKKIMEFAWSTEDAAKSIKKLADATKYAKDLKTTINDWVTNLQVTSLGSTKSQLDAAAKNFSAKMSVINNDFMTAEQKRTALSGITGNADQYIQAIRNFYGSNKEGVDKIQAVVEQVSALPEQLDIQQLQLNALDAIKSSVDGVGISVSDNLKPSLNALLEEYKTANAMDSGILKDSMLSVLDTYGTGILNAFYSGDKNRMDVAAQIASTGISAAGGISKSSNLSEEQKTSTLTALNQATVSAGKFASAYALMPSEANLTLMKKSVTEFTSLISEAFSNITDKNFSMVLVNALSGLSSALNSSNLPLDVMGVLTEGMNNAVEAWSVSAKVGQKESDTLASGVVSYGAYLGKVAGDYTIDETKKAQIYTSFSDASLKLFTNVSNNVGKEEMKSYTKDFVSVLIGKGSAGEASGIGAMGLVTGISTALGNSSITDEQKKPFIDKLLVGTDAFVNGYQASIGAAGNSADITNAKLSLVTGFEKYISDASGFLTMKDATDIAVGITTLNGALNSVITEAARKISEASGIANKMAQEAANQANYNVYAGTNADTTGISPSADFSNVALSTAKTFKDIYGASGLAGEISQKDLLKLADFAGISTDSISRVTQIGDTLKVYGKNGYSVQGDSLPMFAKGGAFTNGVVSEPTMFNMGMMGEAGSEFIMPAAEMPGGKLGVHAIMPKSSNDSNTDSSKEIAELKQEVSELKGILVELVRATKEGNDITLNGFTLTLAENEKQSKSLKTAEKENLRQVYK
jgi:hypothetical protein